MVRGLAIAVTAVALMYQCADTTRMARGFGWTFAVSPLVDAGTPIVQLVGLYVAAGVLMALTVATTTGLCWVGWLRHGDLRGTAGPMSGPVPTLGHADRST